MTQIDGFIASLYRDGVDVDPNTFRAWALEELQSLIAFDAAVWGSGPMSQPHFNTVTTVGVPNEFTRQLQKSKDTNPLLPIIRDNPGQPVDMSEVMDDKAFYSSSLYQSTFEPYGIQRILSSANLEPRCGLLALLSIYRFDRDQPFTEEDKRIQKRVVYHMIQAAGHAFFMEVSRPQNTVDKEFKAVVDRSGVFHQAQPDFLDLLQRTFRGWTHDILPFLVPEPGAEDTIRDLKVSAEALDDLILLRIRASNPLDLLTDRERDVVEQVCDGLSAKAIGRDLGLAPSTVSTHLYRAYRKLGVASRTALAHMVKDLRQ